MLCREGDLAGSRVLEVGCGTGRVAGLIAQAGAAVTGVDPSPEMLAQARRRLGGDVELAQARAEALPFPDGAFDRAVLCLVVHLVDRPRALAEIARVLAAPGALAIATFRPEHFDRFWLNPYFPSIRRLDAARFPDPGTLAAELAAAGFATVRMRPLSQRRRSTRAAALERLRGRFISSLHLIGEEEYRAGLARAERELPDEVEYGLEWAIVVAGKSAGPA